MPGELAPVALESHHEIEAVMLSRTDLRNC